MTKPDSILKTLQAAVIDSCTQLLDVTGTAGARAAIPDTDKLILIGTPEFIVENLPNVDTLIGTNGGDKLAGYLDRRAEAVTAAEKPGVLTDEQIELPPLPAPDKWWREDFGLGDSTVHEGYSVEQMYEYARAFAARLATPAPVTAAQSEQIPRPVNWPIQSFDALDWAQSFMARFGERPDEVDEALMVSWFAAALMRGFDEHAWRTTAAPAAAQAEPAMDKLGGAIKMVVNMLTRDATPVRVEAAGALIAAFGDVAHAAPAAAQAVRVPEGFVLVPVKLTEEMKKAGGHANSEWLNDNAPIGEVRYAMPMDSVYGAILAAAPAAPTAKEAGAENVRPSADAIEELPDLMAEWWAAPRGKKAAEAYKRIVEVIDQYFHATPTTTAAPAQAAVKEVRDAGRYRLLRDAKQLPGSVWEALETGEGLDEAVDFLIALNAPIPFCDERKAGNYRKCLYAIPCTLPAGDTKGEQP
jgi:hypothetical protein